MSDPKRATLITVGATKSEKNKVNKTVRLSINLVESNESKYPELNYKELVIAEERRKRSNIENGKNGKTNEGLNPYSDNDEDVERVARKFEQKYGGKSTYGRKGRSKRDDYADIGAGYDENDPFIDNTEGYDEMMPPDCDTLYGGFYINSGSLEFKNVDLPPSDEEVRGRRNKRRISSSSSEEESSESSSESEASHEEKEPKAVNGDVHSHNTEHRNKKNKKSDKKKTKKIRRTDSSAPTSGKQTSDDNAAGESADSRTSQSDSLTSKPAPSSENPATSDSSRDVEARVDGTLPSTVNSILEELEAIINRQLLDKPHAEQRDVQHAAEPTLVRLERVLCSSNAEKRIRSAAWTRAARALRVSRTKLLQRVRALVNNTHSAQAPAPAAPPAPAPAPAAHKRKADEEHADPNTLTDDEREARVAETLQRLKALIEERKPGMMANYNAECERVQEERKKLQIAHLGGGIAATECTRRLPKRRFPWCARTRALLARLVTLAKDQEAAALLLAKRALPLFPTGFVRMPTLLRQADLSKELKVSDVKRQRTNSQPYQPPAPTFPEPIHFPSTLTVTMKDKDKELPVNVEEKDKSAFGTIVNSFSLSKDLIVEKQDDEKKDDLYIPPNNIGSITITPVVNQKTDKKVNNVSDKPKTEGLLRVKSPAALNEMVHNQEKNKALENIHKRDKDKHRKEKEKHHSHNDKTHKEKRVDSPLHIDTGYHKQKEPTPSPKTKDEVTQRQIESMRIAESNIPRPALIPVHHSPTFAKPDKRPPEKKKKDLLIVSDLDPLADVHTEPVVAVDDSSSDVELVEDKSETSEVSDSVPSKDKVSASKKDSNSEKKSEEMDEATKEDFDSVMKNLRDLEHSREAPKFSNSSYGGVITSAKRDKSSSEFRSRSTIFDPRSDKDKLTNFFEQNGWM